jgi:hypothetical protein
MRKFMHIALVALGFAGGLGAYSTFSAQPTQACPSNSSC